MPNHTEPKPPKEWLEHLSSAGQWERLIEMGRKSLAADPHDCDAHRHIAWAYAKTDRPKEMQPHVEFLLRTDANDPVHHHLGAVYQLGCKKPKLAKEHVEFALREDPLSPTYHYLACVTALRLGDAKAADLHIREARALAPEWAEAAHLQIRIDGGRQTRAREAWERIRRLEETLGLDPSNASVYESIGDIYLRELEDPRKAENFYRQALALDPTDKGIQEELFESIRSRSLLYRTLSMPAAVWKRFRKRQYSLILVIIAIKAFAIFLGWMLLVSVFFVPAAKIYEWFVLTDIHRQPSLLLAPLSKILRSPLWIRMTITACLIMGLWMAILGWTFKTPPLTTLLIMTVVFVIHFIFVCMGVGIRKLRARWGHWQDTRRQRRALRNAIEHETTLLPEA